MRCLLLLSVWICGSASVHALDLDVQARADPSAWLVAELRAREIFDKDLLNAVQSGLPARFRWRVELWEDRSGLWDRLAGSAESELKLIYDALDEEYQVLDGTGRSVLRDADLDAIETLLGQEQIDMLPLEELGDHKYYLVAVLEIRPLTVEEVRDLERWLRGSREGGGIPSQLLGLVRQRLGLGDRSELGRSDEFRPRDLKRGS